MLSRDAISTSACEKPLSPSSITPPCTLDSTARLYFSSAACSDLVSSLRWRESCVGKAQASSLDASCATHRSSATERTA